MNNRKRSLIFFFAVALFHLATSLVHPVTPTLIVERGLDSSLFGVALAAMNLMNFLFSPVWGKLCGRMPIRRILLVGCLGYGLGQTIFAWAYTEWMVMAGRMFAGVFVGGIFTATAAYVVESCEDPEVRGRNLTVMVTIQSVLSAVGYFVGGMLGVISVELAFGVQVAALAATGLLFFGCCREEKVKTGGPRLTLGEVNPFRAFLEARHFMTPMLGLLFGVVMLGALGQNAFEQSFNFCIKDRFGLSSAYNGSFKAAIAVVSLVLNTTLGLWLIRKTDVRRSFVWVMAGCTLPLCAILAFDSLIPFVAADILFFGCNALRLPILQNLAASQAGTGSGSAVMGFYNAMKSLGGILGAFFAGILYGWGMKLPFLLAALAFLAALFLTALFSRKSR